MEVTASACPQLRRPTSKGTAKSAQAFSWLLDLAQSWTVSIPASKGPGFSSPTRAPTFSGSPWTATRSALLVAHMRFPVILCPNHGKAWHQAPAATRAHPARLRGRDRNRLCWAAAPMALATRGQQVPTGSPARGHLSLHRDLTATGHYFPSRRSCAQRQGEAPRQALPLGKQLAKLVCLLQSVSWCSSEGPF